MSELQMAMRLMLIVLCGIIEGHRLNVPKVLLPHHASSPVNFTLEISDPEGGCFRWRSSRPEVASVRPLVGGEGGGGGEGGRECSDRAVVSAVSQHPHKTTAIIFAEEVGTTNVLRCDLMVDKIYSIDIVTTTREIFLEDAPEEFAVRALNDQGDTFSELGGLAFEWTVLEEKSRGEQILKLIPYSESEYETGETIQNLETRGLQGHMILMEGVHTGTAKLSVRIREPQYEKVEPNTITLVVIANLMLNPSYDVRIPVNGIVEYGVELIKQGKASPIKMPSDEYYLQLTDTTIGELNRQTSEVTGLQIGNTQVTLKDKNVEVGELTFRTPSAYIYVVSPASLHFAVDPGRLWVLERGRSYEISLELLDDNAHKMYITKNMVLAAVFPKEYFTVHKTSMNGSHYFVTAEKMGHSLLTGWFKSVVRGGREVKVSPEIRGEQGVEIYDPITVIPPIVAFPWDPIVKARYHYSMKATGGSGDYSWQSANRQLATIGENNGQLITLDVGNTTVTASDVRNRIHRASAQVVVTPPTKMHFSKRNRLEVEIGDKTKLGVEVFGEWEEREIGFTDCRKLSLEVSVVDASVLDRVDVSSSSTGPLPPNACTAITVNGLKTGDTKVIALYRNHGGKTLRAETLVSVYDPLTLTPGFSPLVSIGSSWTVTFAGGPRPWVLDGSKWFASLGEDKKTSGLVSVHPIRKSRVASFQVYCQGIGDTVLHLSVGNGPTSTNHQPATSSGSVKICCSIPQRLRLAPKLASYPTEQGIPQCPVLETDRQPVPAFAKHFPLFVSGLGGCASDSDSDVRTFDNMSSLVVDWKATVGFDLINVPQKGTLESVLDPTRSVLGSDQEFRYFQSIGTKGLEGLATVTASVESYVAEPCSESKERSCERGVEKGLRASVDVALVWGVEVDPPSVSLFNHPSNMVDLRLSKGSGHFLLLPDNKQLASIHHHQNKVELTPRKKGQLNIQVLDLCVPDSMSHSVISISDIHSLEITGPELVEVGKSIRLAVRVKDEMGVQLSSRYFKYMDLAPIMDTTGIILPTEDRESSLDDAVSFVVRGVLVGNGGFGVKARQADGRHISSSLHPIQVFAPLRLLPPQITLIPESIFQIEAIGGPQPRPNLVFLVNETDTVKLSKSGLVESMQLGHVKVTGRIVYSDSKGDATVISEDSVIVHVVSLTGIQIKVPLTKLLTETEMPVYAMGRSESQTPFSFGGAKFPLKFEWSVDNTDAKTGALVSVFHKAQLTEQNDNSFARRFLARQPGHLTVKLRVSQNAGSRFSGGKVFMDSVRITVTDPLQLILPSGICDGHLLMTPNTETLLQINRAGIPRYQVLNEETTLVKVDESTGVVKSGGSSGKALLLISSASPSHTHNQSIVISVEVLPVAYVMLNSEKSLSFISGEELAHLPLKYKWTFGLSFHDSLGRRFHATNNLVSFRPHRLDLTDLFLKNDNRTLNMQLNHPGDTVLKVWDINSPKLSDYIRIPVGSAIRPHSPNHFTAGDIVCLSSPLASGKWTSNKPRVLSIDSEKGIAVARSAGEATVSHVSDAVDATTHQILVSKPNQLFFYPENGGVRLVTNVASKTPEDSHVSTVSLFPVIVGQNEGMTNLQGKDCEGKMRELKSLSFLEVPFVCSMAWEESRDLSPYHVFDVAARFSSTLGSYVCQLKPLPLDTVEKFSRLDSNLVVTATYQFEGIKDVSISEAVARIPFHPAFYLYQNEIHLSNIQHSRTVFYLSATAKIATSLKVKVSQSNVLKVSRAERDGSDPERWEVVVELLSRSQSLWHLFSSNSGELADLHITISSDLTKQERRLPVWIKLYGDAPKIGALCGTDNSGVWGMLDLVVEQYGTTILVLSVVFITLLVMYLTYRVILSFGLNRPGQALVPQGSPGGYGYAQWRSYGGPQMASSFLSNDVSPMSSDSRYDPYSPNGMPRSTTKRMSTGGATPFLWSLDRGQTPPSTGGHRST